jgi:hypothetical protein
MGADDERWQPNPTRPKSPDFDNPRARVSDEWILRAHFRELMAWARTDVKRLRRIANLRRYKKSWIIRQLRDNRRLG